MEVSKVLITALIVATLNSEALSAPRQSPPGTIEVVVTEMIPRRVINATLEMKSLYPFITSNSYLLNPVIILLNINAQICTSSQQLQNNLTIAYKKMGIFISPLFMALSYEKTQGSLHSLLAQSLRDISVYVNASTVMLTSEMLAKGFPVPTIQTGNSEADLDLMIRRHLQALVNRNVLTLVITDDVVKIFRNYVILYSLDDVIRDAADCVRGV